MRSQVGTVDEWPQGLSGKLLGHLSLLLNSHDPLVRPSLCLGTSLRGEDIRGWEGTAGLIQDLERSISIRILIKRWLTSA